MRYIPLFIGFVLVVLGGCTRKNMYLLVGLILIVVGCLIL